jgi:hypothetical protein
MFRPLKSHFSIDMPMLIRKQLNDVHGTPFIHEAIAAIRRVSAPATSKSCSTFLLLKTMHHLLSEFLA